MTSLKIFPLRGKGSNYNHLLHCLKTHSWFSVDPNDSNLILAFCKERNVRLDGILITHGHEDHVRGVQPLVRKFHCPVTGPSIPDVPISNLVGEGDFVRFGNHIFTVMHAPGHTRESLVYWSPQEEVMFVGDLLFYLGCGRAFFSMQALYESLMRIRKFPGTAEIYTGHDYALEGALFAQQCCPDPMLSSLVKTYREKPGPAPFPLSVQKVFNPFLNVQNYATFKRRRMAKDQFYAT